MFGDNNQHMKLNNTIEEGNEERTALGILLTISFCHLLDDTMHSMLPAIYPMLKDEFGLSFFQVGIITNYLLFHGFREEVYGVHAYRNLYAFVCR